MLALAYVLLLAIFALGVPLALNLSARVNAEVKSQAHAQADLVAATAANLMDPAHRFDLTTLAENAARSVRGRVLIVDAAGRVLADSGGPAEIGTSYESRPEIDSALDGRQVQVQRASTTLGQEILATALPIIRDRGVVGAVRITQSVASVHSAVLRTELGLGLIALLVLAIGLSAGGVIAAQVARPLRRLEGVARRVAQGDLGARARVDGSREQQSLARSFNEMTDRIARLLAAQREFVADASHQLRTPLTGLRLRLEEAQETQPDAAAGAELDAAIAEVDRLARTVDELLLLSRSGERKLAGAPVDLADLAASAVHRWRRSAEDREILLEHRRAGDSTSVWAARPDLERALDTLIENAVCYSPSGTTVTIASGLGAIEVRDRGPGIADEEREIVFERFHRGRAGRAGPPGSGLGLAIARELTREWGGEVRLGHRDGGGTIATISLPAMPGTGTPPDADSEPRQPADGKTSFARA